MNDFNMVIEELCEKFNCTLNELIPAYAHYRIICDTIGLVIVLITIIVCIIWLKAYMQGKYLIKGDFYEANAWFGAIGLVISIILSLVLVFELVMWIAMPQMQFFEMIFGQF